MKIDILCNDGSPIGVSLKTVYGEEEQIGVGGAELALLTICEEWHKAGHEVILYNSPRDPNGSPFEQRNKDSFDPTENRDVIIIFRSPNSKGIVAKGMKVWWSTDQFTVGDYRQFSHYIDKIVCISDFHASYFRRTYQINDVIVIDLPVRINDFSEPQVKITNRLIFTSIPDRGLQFLRRAWPQIKSKVKDASLVITSDYRLWGTGAPMNEKHRMHWIGQKDVKFLGAIPRRELVKYELEAQILAYPSIYNELFCIAVAEAQVAGAYPITSGYGSLPTTNMGTVINGEPTEGIFIEQFIGKIIEFLDDDNKDIKQKEVQKKAIERFHPDKILAQWENKVFNAT